MADIESNRKGSWAPLPGVTGLNFRGYPFSGGTVYWPPLWWRRWGRKTFILGAIIGWCFILHEMWKFLHD